MKGKWVKKNTGQLGLWLAGSMGKMQHKQLHDIVGGAWCGRSHAGMYLLPIFGPKEWPQLHSIGDESIYGAISARTDNLFLFQISVQFILL